jgi:hypothetical protein
LIVEPFSIPCGVVGSENSPGKPNMPDVSTRTSRGYDVGRTIVRLFSRLRSAVE